MQCHILFKDSELQNFDWCKLDSSSGSVIKSGQAEVSSLQEICAESSRIIVFLPQQSILLTSPFLPAKASKQQLHAIAYNIEEYVAEDIDDCFFANLPQQSDNSVPVAVIHRDFMDRVIQLLAKNHINSRIILPQIYLCPWTGEDDVLASICELEDGFLVRTGLHEGLFCQQSVLKPMLSVLELNKSSRQQKVILFSDREMEDLNTQTGQIVIDRKPPLDLLSHSVDFNSCINLKQKEYESNHQWLGLIKLWKWPAVAMILVMMVFVASHLLNSWQKNEAYNDLIRQQQQLLLDYKPDLQVSQHPKRQLVKMLADNQQSAGQSGFLELLYEYSRLKAEFKAVETLKIQYQQSRLAVNLQTSDLNSMESFRNKLQKSEFQTDIENVNINPDKTTGRLVMGAK